MPVLNERQRKKLEQTLLDKLETSKGPVVVH